MNTKAAWSLQFKQQDSLVFEQYQFWNVFWDFHPVAASVSVFVGWWTVIFVWLKEIVVMSLKMWFSPTAVSKLWSRRAENTSLWSVERTDVAITEGTPGPWGSFLFVMCQFFLMSWSVSVQTATIQCQERASEDPLCLSFSVIKGCVWLSSATSLAGNLLFHISSHKTSGVWCRSKLVLAGQCDDLWHSLMLKQILDIVMTLNSQVMLPGECDLGNCQRPVFSACD